MERKDIDWGSLGFGYVQTDYRYVANYKDGKWDEGGLTDKATIEMSECACVLQYAQTCFEGLKAYTTADGKIVCFRPDLNAQRMADSCRRMKMPVLPEEQFVDAVVQTVRANAQWVPPYGSGASLYLRPFMFGINPVIGVKPATEFQFRIFATPVGPYFKGGIKPLTLRISDFDRAAPRGTGHIKAGLNYAMSLYAIVDAHEQGYDENVYLDSATRILGLEVEERPVALEELGDFAECGLCGTAAVISPVGKIVDHDRVFEFAGMGPVIQQLYDTLRGIQMGTVVGPEGWVKVIE